MQGPHLKIDILLNEQANKLNEQANKLMSQWPKYSMHEITKCHLPEHPCTIIQVLDLAPELRISVANQGNSPMLRRVTSASLDKICTRLELLLGQKPQWECLEDVKLVVKDLHF